MVTECGIIGVWSEKLEYLPDCVVVAGLKYKISEDLNRLRVTAALAPL